MLLSLFIFQIQKGSFYFRRSHNATIVSKSGFFQTRQIQNFKSKRYKRGSFQTRLYPKV
ncbi:hypothetical protein Patl1_34279 [Pistacia atlantica]|uniref:Uncharacterized protein n=1 Tax=Pistacia atlantica TaxID=434234 RepID=A0ACC0ZQU8_9ROSI|nr:hypothetical protein Patl1_34279 [Pistacia atlantica]